MAVYLNPTTLYVPKIIKNIKVSYLSRRPPTHLDLLVHRQELLYVDDPFMWDFAHVKQTRNIATKVDEGTVRLDRLYSSQDEVTKLEGGQCGRCFV
jgi:hypothetical protein